MECKHEWNKEPPRCPTYEPEGLGSNGCYYESNGECTYAKSPKAELAALRASLAAAEAECERLRSESAEAFADWCDSRQPAFQAESLYGDVVAMCDLVDRFRAALAAGER